MRAARMPETFTRPQPSKLGMDPHSDGGVRYVQQMGITRFASPFELFATCEIHNIRPSRVHRMGRLY